ncbi:MAG TPA: SipW-dependent-type signal peptide-containing protein [Actinomycetota bacterium]|jgi:predicted ribosomally synthesized peptide with SipW-like signal peptide|nr:SipW-dependent-type signal peptide-containing protein [Actinomycetota bacterium]
MAENDREKRGRKLLLTLLVVGVVGSIAGIGTFSAFSDTTENAGNTFAAGTVYITDNDADSAMFDSNAANPAANAVAVPPGAANAVSSCITVTYLGTMDADVKIYGGGFTGPLSGSLTMTVEEGQGAAGFGDCTGFVADGTVYTGAFDAFAPDYAGGYLTGGTWTKDDSVDYRITIEVQDDNSANGGAAPLATDPFTFTWEARNV